MPTPKTNRHMVMIEKTAICATAAVAGAGWRATSCGTTKNSSVRAGKTTIPMTAMGTRTVSRNWWRACRPTTQRRTGWSCGGSRAGPGEGEEGVLEGCGGHVQIGEGSAGADELADEPVGIGGPQLVPVAVAGVVLHS